MCSMLCRRTYRAPLSFICKLIVNYLHLRKLLIHMYVCTYLSFSTYFWQRAICLNFRQRAIYFNIRQRAIYFNKAITEILYLVKFVEFN